MAGFSVKQKMAFPIVRTTAVAWGLPGAALPAPQDSSIYIHGTVSVMPST